ncbi:MAG: YoaK family protein [Sphingobacteriaceae bacterium]
MFRHKGKSRTYIHNLRLASILSFVAGTVNITGVLSVKVLTTNVTGHFAYFSEELSNEHYGIAVSYLLFILSFLFGAFASNFFIEIFSRVKPAFSYAVPMAIETTILLLVGLFGNRSVLSNIDGQVIACSLLFAMGLQNSLVTKVSQSVVRTTHLTGLFTDLGIELSQLFFYRKTPGFKRLSKSIYLKLAIIGCFFLGCLVGGIVFKSHELQTLFLAAFFLIIAFFYDNILFRYYHVKRKVQSW